MSSSSSSLSLAIPVGLLNTQGSRVFVDSFSWIKEVRAYYDIENNDMASLSMTHICDADIARSVCYRWKIKNSNNRLPFNPELLPEKDRLVPLRLLTYDQLALWQHTIKHPAREVMQFVVEWYKDYNKLERGKSKAATYIIWFDPNEAKVVTFVSAETELATINEQQQQQQQHLNEHKTDNTNTLDLLRDIPITRPSMGAHVQPSSPPLEFPNPVVLTDSDLS